MNAELVKSEPTELARQDEPQSIMHVIARAAADPTVNVEKMQALLNMKMQMEERDAKVEFAAALARLMPRLPRIQKNGTIPDNNGKVRSRFARYEDIDIITRPLLAEEGFSVSFRTEEPSPGNIRVIGTLAHRMGYSKESSVTVPISAPPKATGTQAVGSSVSYGKRYVITNLLNIITVGEDNDGQGDPQTITEEQVLTIETLMTDTGADRKRFLNLAGVERVEDILTPNFPILVKALQAKKRQA